MTVAGGRVAYRQRSFAHGGGVSGKLERERATLGRDRRPGGVSQGAARASTRSPARRQPWSGAPRRSGCRSSSPSSTRRASAATVPTRSPSTCPTDVEPLEKVRFSAAEAEGFDLGGRDQALVCGIETHVCVNQTVLDLLDAGRRGPVVADAVGSRSEDNRRDRPGQGRARRSGADQRRDGAVRARSAAPAATSSSGCRSWSSSSRQRVKQGASAATRLGSVSRTPPHNPGTSCSRTGPGSTASWSRAGAR